MKISFVVLMDLVFITSLYAQNRAPIVSNVVVHQRTGTKFVDITYDVFDADGNTLQISVYLSNDGGKTYTICRTSLSGDVGLGIMPGTGRSIVWNAGTDYPYKYETKFQAKVTAEDYKAGSPAMNDDYGDYVFVPAGPFQMGDNFNEGYSPERPVHTVFLDAYYIGKFEVTNAEYQKFIDDGGYTTQTYWSSGGFGKCGNLPYYWNDATYRNQVHGGGTAGNENYPVVGVSWYEANAYCKWLSVKTGITYRLPTEAEWEKAARGDSLINSTLGHQRRYPWGDSIDASYANYRNSGSYFFNGLTIAGFYNGSTHGSLVTHDNASPYGAYDMVGNVWEWCNDWYDSVYYQECLNRGIVINPKGSLSGNEYVIRGGSWYNYVSQMRSAFRYTRGGIAKWEETGFRWVREP